jgi:hypothetical protein
MLAGRTGPTEPLVRLVHKHDRLARRESTRDLSGPHP